MCAHLHKATLAHCKGASLAVAVNIACEGGVCDAHRRLPCDLRGSRSFCYVDI